MKSISLGASSSPTCAPGAVHGSGDLRSSFSDVEDAALVVWVDCSDGERRGVRAARHVA